MIRIVHMNDLWFHICFALLCSSIILDADVQFSEMNTKFSSQHQSKRFFLVDVHSLGEMAKG